MTNPLQAGVAGVIETLEALTRGLKKDDFDAGAWAARSEALDMLRPLIAEPLVSPLQAGVDHAELLPCPFCGEPPEIVHIESGDDVGGSCVSCTKCQASSNLEFGFKENFVSNWNRRAAPVLPDRGWRPDREAVAREIVDCVGVGTLGLTFDASLKAAGDIADRILALPDAPAEGAE